MHLHLGHYNIDSLRDVFHLAIVLGVLFKIHVLDRQISLLERRFTNK